MTASPLTPTERISSKIQPNMVYTFRRGAGLADALTSCGAEYLRDVEAGFVRLAPEFRSAVEHRELEALATIQQVLRLYFSRAALLFLKAGIVQVIGLKDHPITAEEFAASASAELIVEANNLVAEGILAIQGPAATEGRIVQ